MYNAEIDWYRQHGKYPERITTDNRGVFYIVGDWSWHRLHPTQREPIEARMKAEGVYGK